MAAPFALMAGLTLLVCSLQAESASVLKDVRFWSSRGVTRVAMETSGASRFEHNQIKAPPRVYVDLYDVMPNKDFRGLAYSIPVNDGVVKQIRVAPNRAGVTRVVLDVEGEVEVRINQLANPDRVILDVRLAHGTEAPDPSAFETSPTSAIPPPATIAPAATTAEPPRREPARTAQAAPKPYQPPPTPRIVQRPLFTWDARFPQVNAQPTTQARLPQSLDVRMRANRPSAPVVARATPAPPPPVVQSPAVPAPAAKEPTSVQGPDAKPAQRTRRGSQSLTRALGLKLNRVMLDPGHGGNDHGTSVRGLLEKNVSLDVARRLGKLLEENLGTEVIYTRTDDRYIALDKRPELANQVKADLFLSIHVNSSPLRSVSGAETFYLDFSSSSTDMEVAARENASSEKSIHELQDLIRKIASQDKAEESREFAARVQRASHDLVRKLNAKARNRGVKRAPFVVLIGATMPAVLAEIGFITNPADEARMRKPEHRQQIAEALFEGIREYAQTLSHFPVARRSGSE